MPSAVHLELTGPQFKPLSAALRATLSLSKFDIMLKEKLDINREDIALGDDYTDIVFKVIREANQAGWVYKLVEAARQVRPNQPIFVEYARIVGIGPRGLPNQAELESIISKTNTLFDVAVFRSRLGEIESQVCRIDVQGAGTGTGFLVGPGAVLTNYHVIEAVVKNTRQLADFTCRFDYKMREDGGSVNQGSIFKVKELLAYSEYDPADLVHHGQQPDPEKLDYALLALDGEPGNEQIGKEVATSDIASRGWVALPAADHNFAPKSPLFIVQHPDRKPMKLALDTEAIIGLNGNGTRVQYTTNTEPGSSGSPCFDQHWNVVALHHSGDPNWIPTWNQGIPIMRVQEQLRKKGMAEHLGS
jgi:hypothetical protein